MERNAFIGEETPEQAARAISAALDFLRQEADAVGMPEVSELIAHASKKTLERISYSEIADHRSVSVKAAKK